MPRLWRALTKALSSSTSDTRHQPVNMSEKERTNREVSYILSLLLLFHILNNPRIAERIIGKRNIYGLSRKLKSVQLKSFLYFIMTHPLGWDEVRDGPGIWAFPV